MERGGDPGSMMEKLGVERKGGGLAAGRVHGRWRRAPVGDV
jgi:hypothetical protein